MTQFLNSSLPVDTPAYGRIPLHCLQPPVILLQIADSLLCHPYCILKGKDLPQLLQAKISWVSLNNLVVQAKPVPLGFNSSKTCSMQSFHNSLTASAGGVKFYL